MRLEGDNELWVSESLKASGCGLFKGNNLGHIWENRKTTKQLDQDNL
jgi:hypothetical protein